jgi:tetratricopeptide (TPR) repeat protein
MSPEQQRGDRYPGGRPFADNELDRRLFFGRENETEELTNQIISCSLLVVFGKSGMGKTSLLQAGAFPQLRQHQLLPLMIRLNQPNRSLMEDFLTDIAEQCRTQAFDHTPGESGSLWEYFKTSAFWCKGELQTPVLVIDQAEEIFTLRPPEMRKRIAEELGQLLRSGLPTSIRERRERGEEISYSEKPPQLKVILSLREDYLGHLEELAGELPQILEKRFRLTPLERAAARRAVIEPAALPQGNEFRTVNFEYTDAAVDEILDFLTGKDRQIEPFQLQVLCHHVERMVAAAPAATATPVVKPGSLGGKSGMESILTQFYRTAVNRVRGTRQRKRARTLCEDGLLDEAGRRDSLEEEQIRKKFKLANTTLDSLVDSRVLRKEPRLSSFYYEISHDSLAVPILRSRRWRMPRRFRRGLVWAVVGTAATVLFSVMILALIGTAYFEAEKITERMLEQILWPLMELEQHELLETVSQEAIAAYEAMGTEYITDSGFNNRALVYQTRGSLRGARWEFTAALADHEKAVEHFNAAAAAAPSDGTYHRNMALAELSVAETARSLGQGAKSLEHFRLAAAAAQTAMTLTEQDTDRARSLQMLAEAQLAIAEMQQDRGELSLAATTLRDSRTNYEALAAIDKVDPALLASRLWVIVEGGRQLSDRGGHAAALQEYQQAESIAGAAYEQSPREMYVRQNLIAVDDRIAEIELLVGDYARGFNLSSTNWLHQQELFKDHAEPNIEHNLARTQARLADVMCYGVVALNALRGMNGARSQMTLDAPATASLDSAMENYRGSQELLLKLLHSSSEHAGVKLDLALVEKALGDGYAATNQHAPALAHYRKAQELLQELLQTDAGNQSLQYHAVEVNVEIARTLLSSGETGAVSAMLLEALRAQEKLVHHEPGQTLWQVTLADAHEAIGDSAAAASNAPAARKHYAAAHEIRNGLRQLSPRHVGWTLQDAVTLYKLSHFPIQPEGNDASAKLAREAIQSLRGHDEANRVAPVARRVAEIMLASL